NAPSGLPTDLGQRQSVLMEAMDQALSAGYSREYQSMIRRYFNSLKKIDSIARSDSSKVQ
ncbi:MAG: hypothetical protein VX547_07155, partial [Candidatus Neomarinimicrobiota bacterium]|nr:hypothetical protein [Candidatus Neomarinimicrobiota bacterium]